MNTKIDYPAHIYDPLRRKIAVRYLRHELRKLFPSMRDEAMWAMLDAEVGKWYDGNATLMPVRDFWNGLHGISMGFRLKNIVSWLTSENMSWEEKSVALDELHFSSTLDDLKPVGVAPSAVRVREWFFAPEQAEALMAAKAKAAAKGAETSERDSYPVFVIRKEGVLRVVDGNRRLLQAILKEQKTIQAVVGEPKAGPPIFNAWVPTSLLLELVSMYHHWGAFGRDLTDSIATIIAELIRDSKAGKIEFEERSLAKGREEDTKLLEAVRAKIHSTT